MFVTTNRARDLTVLLVAVVAFVTACGPPGPRALLEGRKRLEAGQTEAAINNFRTATALLPTNATAWNYLGLAYHRAGQVTNAAEAYSRAIKLDRELLEARFNLGCLWLDENKLEPAKTELTAYTLRRGNAPEGWLKLGAAHWRGRESAAAEKCFREVLRIETNNVEALNGLGLVQLQRNRPREAAAFFDEALKLRPDYRPALLNLATVAQQQLNDRPEALRRYRQYLALQPRAADWDAVSAVVRSLEQPPVAQPQPRPQPNHLASNPPAITPQATNQAKPPVNPTTTRPAIVPKPESNTVAAKPTPTPAVMSPTATPPTTPPSPQPEVIKLASEPVIKSPVQETKPPVTGAGTAAPRVTAPAIKTQPAKSDRTGFLSKLNPFRSDSKSSDNTNALGSAAATPARLAAAPGRYAYLSPVLPKAGDRPSAEVALGQGQQSSRANRPAEALQSFRRATQLDPTYYEAYYNLGLTSFRLRSFPVALSAWEMAVALRPNDADARYNFALTLKAAGYPQDAADELEKLLALHPDEARGHLTLGNLYAEPLKDIPRARRHYNKVLQLDPRNPQAQAIRYWLVAHPG